MRIPIYFALAITSSMVAANPGNDELVGDLADNLDALDVDDGELISSVQEVVPMEGLSPSLAEEEEGYPINAVNARVKRPGKCHIGFSQYSIQFCI